MENIKSLKFPIKNTFKSGLGVTKSTSTSTDNSSNDSPPPTSSSFSSSASNSPAGPEILENDSEKNQKLKFPSTLSSIDLDPLKVKDTLSSIDLDPLKVKDHMGKFGGKMKNSFTKISSDIKKPLTLTKKSSHDGQNNNVDEFDQVIDNLGQLSIPNDTTPPPPAFSQQDDGTLGSSAGTVTSAQLPQQQQQQQQQQIDDTHQGGSGHQSQQHGNKSKNVVQQMTHVKGKLNKFGQAAKQRLSNLQTNAASSLNYEDNDSAHSNSSKEGANNNSLTTTARLSRTIPIKSVPTQAPSSSSTSELAPSTTNKSPSAILAEDLLEILNDPERDGEGLEEEAVSPTRKLSRRPSEFLEFESPSTSSTNLAEDPPYSYSSSSSAHLSSSSGQNETSGVLSHTPFLIPKVKKLNFLKNSPSSTPPLEASDLSFTPEDGDPYYQPYAHYHHPPSLSGAKHWVEKKILNKRNVHHLHTGEQQNMEFFLQTEKVEDDNCV